MSAASRRRGAARRPASFGAAARARWARHAARVPLLRWVSRWGVSIVSLGLGLMVLFVFRRGLPHIGWIVGYLLLLWLVFGLLAELRASLEERGRRLVVGAAEYTIQTLYHGLLLFVVPAYWAAATLDSVNALFPAGVAAGVVLTAVDPWYRRLVHPRPWLNHLLFGFSIFAALNVALPLVGVRPILALEGSAVLAVMALTPEIRRRGRLTWRAACAWAGALALAALLAAWVGRGLVPPAPLFLARAVPARAVAGLEPVEAVEDGRIPAATVEAWGGVAAYTAVYAPAGLKQPIEHVWWRDGALLARIVLPTPVLGGRAQGFRTHSRRELGPPLAGRYVVDVVTASGQLIGRLRFTVTP